MTDVAWHTSLESPNPNNAALNIYRAGRDREHFRYTRATVAQCETEMPRLERSTLRGVAKTPTLSGIKILPTSGWVEKTKTLTRLAHLLLAETE